MGGIATLGVQARVAPTTEHDEVRRFEEEVGPLPRRCHVMNDQVVSDSAGRAAGVGANHRVTKVPVGSRACSRSTALTAMNSRWQALLQNRTAANKPSRTGCSNAAPQCSHRWLPRGALLRSPLHAGEQKRAFPFSTWRRAARNGVPQHSQTRSRSSAPSVGSFLAFFPRFHVAKHAREQVAPVGAAQERRKYARLQTAHVAFGGAFTRRHAS